MPGFVEQILHNLTFAPTKETPFPPSNLEDLTAQAPYVFDCIMDYFAHREDMAPSRRFHPRAIAIRRLVAFLLEVYKLKRGF